LRRGKPCELFHEPGETRRIRTQNLDFLATVADFTGDALKHAAPLAPLGKDSFTVGAARCLQPRKAFLPRQRLGGEALRFGERSAVVRQHRGRGAGDIACVVEVARRRGGIVPRERHTQRFRGTCGVTRHEHSRDRLLALGERALEAPALGGEIAGLGAHLGDLGFDALERAVRLRDGALGIAQRVARFPPGLFLALEIAAERLDAAAQRLQVLFFRRGGSGRGPQAERKKKDGPQALTFPCADTAATRRATSAGSPRYWWRSGFKSRSSS
jgi:hypothetical protein